MATSLKQDRAPSKQRLVQEFGITSALSDTYPLKIHSLPIVFTLPGESFPVTVAGDLAPGISALHFWHFAPHYGKNAVRFVTAPEALKLGRE